MDHVKSFEIVMPRYLVEETCVNSGVVNGVIIEHGVVLMSDPHVNTFVWAEVHVSLGGPLRQRIEIILKCLTIRN